MVEMMVVIGVIALLGAITLAIGTSVIRNGKVRQTQQVLTTLDAVLEEYMAEYGGIPPFDRNAFNEPKEMNEGGTVRPEVAAFLVEAQGLDGATRQIAAIPEQVLVPRFTPRDPKKPNKNDPDPNSLFGRALAANMTNYTGVLDDWDVRPTVCDAWGMEILFIHPEDTEAVSGLTMGGTEFNGYGRPANNRPYFLSAGPDRRYYHLVGGDTVQGMADNLYSYAAVERPASE